MTISIDSRPTSPRDIPHASVAERRQAALDRLQGSRPSRAGRNAPATPPTPRPFSARLRWRTT